MTSRQRKSLLVYLGRTIVDMGNDTYVVQGRKMRDGKRGASYVVQPHPDNGQLGCACAGFQEVADCKHIDAVRKKIMEGDPPPPYANARDRIDETRRTTYPQDNARYRLARRVMMRALPLAVRALAHEEFPVATARRRPPGPPRIPMRDVVTCIAMRSIHGRSGELVQPFVDHAFASKLLYRRPTLRAHPPASVTISARMRQSETAQVFTDLIARSNLPSRGKPVRLAFDGSEFNVPVLMPGKKLNLVAITTVKLHAAVDVDDGTIVAATVTPGKQGDSTQARPLLDMARRVRFVVAICADKGYFDESFIAHCQENDITIAVPPKVNTSVVGDGVLARYKRAWAARTEDEKDLYGRRQWAEGTFSRIKRLTDEDLRGRTFDAQKCELLSHVLVAQMAWLIARYVADDLDLPFLDNRCRSILDEARAAVADEPRADRSPRFRDGLPDVPDAA